MHGSIQIRLSAADGAQCNMMKSRKKNRKINYKIPGEQIHSPLEPTQIQNSYKYY